MNIDAVYAEKRLATEKIDDPGLLFNLILKATGDKDRAEDAMVHMIDQQMRQGT